MRDLRDYLLGNDWNRPTTDASVTPLRPTCPTEVITREVEVMTEARVRAIVAQVIDERGLGGLPPQQLNGKASETKSGQPSTDEQGA